MSGRTRKASNAIAEQGLPMHQVFEVEAELDRVSKIAEQLRVQSMEFAAMAGICVGAADALMDTAAKARARLHGECTGGPTPTTGWISRRVLTVRAGGFTGDMLGRDPKRGDRDARN